MVMSRTDGLGIVGIVLMLALGSNAGLAQAQGSGGDEGASDNRGLEMVIVTARKREELAIDVPLSVTSFGAEEIDNYNLNNIIEVSRLTPNFTYVDIAQRYIDAPIVRGITSDLLDNTRQAASFFVDGVYVTGSSASIAFSDIERIEVLRGPQSVLFGRATFAGAVNYVTKAPSNEFSGSVNVSGAEDDDYEVVASISGPMGTDTVRYRLAGRYFSYGGEWQNTLVDSSQSLGGQESRSISGTLQFEPSDTVAVTAKATYTEDDDELGATLLLGADSHNCNVGLNDIGYVCGEVSFDESRLGMNIDELATPGLLRDQLRTSVKLEWDVGAMLLTAISAYNDEETNRLYDIDFEAAQPFLNSFGIDGDAAQVDDFLDYQDFSQELRLQSADDSALQWLVGLYYLDLEVNSGRLQGPTAFNPAEDREETNQAVFASVEYAFGNGLTVTAEGRYQRAEIDIVDPATGQPFVIGNPSREASETFNSFLPRLTVSYDMDSSLTVYGYYAQGNRPGTFNINPLLAAELTVADEEEIDSFEIGTKFEGWDGRLSGSVALFYNDIGNLTTRSTFIPPGTTVPISFLEDAGSQTTQGIEISLNAQLSDAFRVTGMLGYTDSELEEAVTISSQRLLGTTEPGAVEGNRPALVPDLTAALTARYEVPLGDGSYRGYLDGDVSFRGSSYGDDANFAETGDSTRVNVRAGLSKDDWRIELFARNLFDDDTPLRVSSLTQFSTFAQGVIMTPQRSRQLGVRASLQF